MIVLRLFLAIILSAKYIYSYGTPLVYKPENPSFGGNPIYGNYLLSNANSQNKFRDPRYNRKDKTALEDFNDRLQRSILNRLTNTIANNFVSNEGKLIPGITETEDFIIEIVNLGDSIISVTTTEKLSGSSTTFIIESD